MFLDRTMIPEEEGDDTIWIESDTFCGRWWKDSFQIEGPVKACLDQFYDDALPSSFGKFMKALRKYISVPGNQNIQIEDGQTIPIKIPRIWIIIDEVVLFEDVKYLISLPKEQALGPFNWIITGSAGIGSWVSMRHLENLVFDLPLFTKAECVDFTSRLSNNLGINLEDALRIPLSRYR